MALRSLYADVAIPEVSLPAFTLERASARGDKPALIDGPSGRTITYRQLGNLVARAAPPAWPAAASRRASVWRFTARTCPSTPSRFTRSPPSVAS
jgi:hypothetical protein